MTGLNKIWVDKDVILPINCLRVNTLTVVRYDTIVNRGQSERHNERGLIASSDCAGTWRDCYQYHRLHVEHTNHFQQPLEALLLLAGIPVEGKSSVCLICMKYRIIILIIFFISLGQILLSYIANTSRTHAHACAHVHARAHKHIPVAPIQVNAIRWRPTMTARSAGIHSR